MILPARVMASNNVLTSMLTKVRRSDPILRGWKVANRVKLGDELAC